MKMRSAWILFSLLAMWQQAPQSAQARQRPQAAQQPRVPQGPQRPAPRPAQEFRISGIVQDAVSGSPVEGADVLIESSGPPGQEKADSVETSADGHFVFEHLPAGKYALSARCRGYAPQKYQQHEGFTTAIAVGAQLDSENIVFPIFPEAVIAGQVTDESGEAVRRAEVMLYEEMRVDGRISVRRHIENAIGQHLTDDQGRYRFGELQKGRYYVAVSAHPWYAQNITDASITGRVATDSSRPFTRLDAMVEENESLDVVYPLTFYAGTTDSARASTISLEPGEMVTADVSIAAVPALHLQLTAPGLDLSQSTNVSVMQSAFGLPAEFANTIVAWHGDGSAVIVGVPPGEIRINAQQSNGNGKMALLFNETLTASQGMEINLNHQARGVPVSGIVKLAAGANLPPRSILFLRDPQTGGSWRATIGPDGGFDFGDFPTPGRYALSFGGASNWYVRAVQAEGASVSGRLLDLQTADPVRLTVELSQGLGRVEGVALRDAKGAGGVMIFLVSKDPRGSASVVGRAQSDSDGTFEISDVPPGDYSILAVQNGWDDDWADAELLQSWLSGGAAVTVAPNGKPRVQVNVQ